MNSASSELHFVVCVGNAGWDDLKLLKLYRVLPDETASADRLLRVIDESGEDFLYPSSCFISVSLTEDAIRVVEELAPSTAPA